MTYQATTVDEYVSQIPDDRKGPFGQLRSAILENLPQGFEECMSYSMPSYSVPHSIYPAGYHCKPEEPLPFLSIASQKNFIAYYHMGVYSMPELLQWFQTEWADRGLGKLDMGKSCIRLKKVDSIPFDLLGELASKITVDQWIAGYERAIKK
jgi:uncharacterized protein YdhG (YjbR/CyaY superfamily)